MHITTDGLLVYPLAVTRVPNPHKTCFSLIPLHFPCDRVPGLDVVQQHIINTFIIWPFCVYVCVCVEETNVQLISY